MKQIFAILCLLLASIVASAQAQDCTALTHQALELSGFSRALAQSSDLLSSDEFMQQLAGGRDVRDFLTIFKPIVMKDYNGQLMSEELQAKVAAHCDPALMQQVLERMQTPIMVRMLALEAASSTPEGRQRLKHYLKIAQTVPATDDRMDAIDALDKSLGSSDFATDSVIATTRGMMTGIGATPEMAAQLESHRREMKDQMMNVTELSMSVVYHGVTRADMAQYGKEMSEQPLKGFYDRVEKAFLEIAEEHAKAVGKDLKTALEARKASNEKS